MNRGFPLFLLTLVLSLCSAPALFAITRNWTGAVSANWSEPGNWSPAGVPQPADVLVLSAPGSQHASMTNDLPAGTTVGPLKITGPMTLSGNPLTLSGDVVAGAMTWNIDLKIGASLSFNANGSTFNGAIDVNGQTLTFNTVNFTPFKGAWHGRGNVVFYGFGPPVISGGGDFSGNMTGVVDLMSDLPNAAIVDGAPGAVNTDVILGGHGSVANLLISRPYSNVDLSSTWTAALGQSGLGTIHTGTLTIGGTYHAHFAGTVSDRIEATGAVTLSGHLVFAQRAHVESITVGTFTIIDNQGTSPVNGTFDGLPEGATVAGGPFTFRISYKGGDGNDVVLTPIGGPVRQWSDGCNNERWSDPCNWSPQGVPASGEALDFGTKNAGNTDANDDLPAGFVVGGLRIRDNYSIGGNRFVLAGDVSSVNGGTVGELTLGKDATASGDDLQLSRVHFAGHILTSTNSHLVIINASDAGAIVARNIALFGSGDFSGRVLASYGVTLTGAFPNADIDTLTLEGGGSARSVTIEANGFVTPGQIFYTSKYNYIVATLTTGDLILRGKYSPLVKSTTSDRIRVSGNVDLSGATLEIIPTDEPPASEPLTIIENAGSAPISGTFANLPEGALVPAGNVSLRISYFGGDGNDVVLSAVPPSSPRHRPSRH
jgi:hypothetical protein